MTYAPMAHTLWGYNEAGVFSGTFWQDMMRGPYSPTSGAYGLGLRVGSLRCYTPAATGAWSGIVSTCARRATSGNQPSEIDSHDGGVVPFISCAAPQGTQPNGKWGYRSICDKTNHATAGAHTGYWDGQITSLAQRFYLPWGSGGAFHWGAAVDPSKPGGQYSGNRSSYLLWGGVPHEANGAQAAVHGYNDDGTDPGPVICGQRYIAAQEHIFDIFESVRIANSQPVRVYFFPILAYEWDANFIVPTAYTHGRGIDQYYPSVSSGTHYTLSQFHNSFTGFPKWDTYLNAAKASDGANVAIAFGEWASGFYYDATDTLVPSKSGEFIRGCATTLTTLRVTDGGPRIWTFPWFQSNGLAHRIDPGVAGEVNFAAFHDGAVTLAGSGSAPTQPTSFNVINVTASTADVYPLDPLPAGGLGWNVYKNGSATKLTNSSSTTVSLPANISFWHISTGLVTDYWEFTQVGSDGSESTRSPHVTVAFTTSADTTPPPVPAAPTLGTPVMYQLPSGAFAARVQVSWVASTAIDIGTYGVYVGGVLYGDRLASSVTSLTVQDLAPSTLFTFTVDAADTSGNTSAQSASASVTTPAAPDVTPPTFPTLSANLTQTGTSPGGFTLACDAASDSETGVRYYEWMIDGVISRTSGPLFTATGLVQGHTGSAQVRALDGNLNFSAWSTPAITTLTGSFTGRPTANCVVTPAVAIAPVSVVFNVSGSISQAGGALTFWFDPGDGSGAPFPALYAVDGVTRLSVAAGSPATTYTAFYPAARVAHARVLAVDVSGGWDLLAVDVRVGWPGIGFSTPHGWALPLPYDYLSAGQMKQTLMAVDTAVTDLEANVAVLQSLVLAGGGTLTPTTFLLSWAQIAVTGTAVVTPTVFSLSWAQLQVTP